MKNNSFNLPTPGQLIKRAKEETIPVSLRVKEHTLAVFNNIAEEGKMKVGSVINSLLDAYAAEFGSDTISKDILSDYLTKNATKLSKMSAEQLIVHMCEKGMPWPMVEEYDGNVAFATNDFKNAPEKGDFHIEPGYRNEYSMITGYDICIIADSKTKFEQEDDVYIMMIAYEKWPLVATLLNDYARKFFKQYPENDYYLTPEMAEKIVNIVDKEKDWSVIAKSITKVLIDYLESMDD